MEAGSSHLQATSGQTVTTKKRRRNRKNGKQKGQRDRRSKKRKGDRRERDRRREDSGRETASLETTPREREKGCEECETGLVKEEKSGHVESECEVKVEKERRAQKARKEQRRAQEAREEKSAHVAREERRAHGAREKRAQLAREEMRVQEAREKEVKAEEERERQEREVEAQDGHEEEGERTTREQCVVQIEEESNSIHEVNDVSNRHDLVAEGLVDPYRQPTTSADGARPSTDVACSHQSSPGRRRTDRRGTDHSQQRRAALQ